MHALVRIIVEAQSPGTALEKARNEFTSALVEGFQEEGYVGPFDSAELLPSDAAVPSSPAEGGSERYLCYRADSSEGRGEIEVAWRDTEKHFAERFSEIISEVCDADATAVMNDEHIRHRMSEMAAEPPTTIHFLYNATRYDDQYIWPISTPDRYESLLDELDGKWVVPLDAHY